MDINQALAETLRAERAARRVTLRELAAQADVPLRSLVRYMDGERPIGVALLAQLAGPLQRRPSELMAEAERRLARAEPNIPEPRTEGTP